MTCKGDLTVLHLKEDVSSEMLGEKGNVLRYQVFNLGEKRHGYNLDLTCCDKTYFQHCCGSPVPQQNYH